MARFTCHQCGNPAEQPASAVNRARRRGAHLFCDRACAGIARRLEISPAEKKARKQVYDANRRKELRDELLAAKREYHKRTYDPVVAAVKRKARMPYHVEYCRSEKYREWKREYDRRYRSLKEYGEFADCFMLVMDIRAECLSQFSDYDIRYSKGGIGKAQNRKRDHEKLIRNIAQVGSMGNLERGKGWQDGGRASGLDRLPGAGDSSYHEHAVARGSAGEKAGIDGRNFVRGNLRGNEGAEGRS